MKSKCGVTISVCVLCFFALVIVAIILGFVSPSSYYCTNEVDNYNKDDYQLPSVLFPEQIPSNADVVHFSYYSYWYEKQDYYLELKFESTEEMEFYLKELKKRALENNPFASGNKRKVEFVEKENLNNSKFVDLFYSGFLSYYKESTYTGYKVQKNGDGDKKLYLCNFGGLSYSYEECVVISFYTVGTFGELDDDYMPKYFTRFFDSSNPTKDMIIDISQ